MYYNDAIKQDYLATMRAKSQITGLFAAFKAKEEELQQDVGAMSDEQALALYQSLNTTNLTTIKIKLPYLNSYRRWYREHFNDWDRNSSDSISYKQIDLSRSMRNTFVCSWSDIMDELRAVDYDFYQGYEAAPILAFSWLGINVLGATTLLKEQIDCKNGLIFDSHHTLQVRDMEAEIKDIFSIYQNTAEATRTRNQVERVYANASPYFIHRMDSENNTKSVNEPRAPATMLHQIRMLAADYETRTGKPSKMVPQNVLYSGCYHRLHQYMQTNPNTKNREVQFEMRRRIGYNNMPVSEMMYLYEQYKKAFNLY